LENSSAIICSCTVRGLPIREDIQIPVQEQMIVELFSK